MKIIEFIKETRVEMKHVVWPTKKQTIVFTIVVIVISVLVAYTLGAFDSLFTSGLEKIISL